MDKAKTIGKKIIPFIFLALLIFVFYYSAEQQAIFQNTSSQLTDQQAYILFMRNLVENDYRYTDGSRAPLYMLFQSLFHSQNDTDQMIFEQGKQVNIVLSILLLICIYYFSRKYIKPPLSIYFILIPAITIFALKAPYFQPELLYYTLFFFCFVLMLEMLHQPNWITAVLLGLATGLAQLTKASILVALVLFVIFYAAKTFYTSIKEKSPPGKKWAFLLICVTIFALVIYPDAKLHKEKYGHWFYNVNTTFYIWYDSWDEVVAGTRAFKDREGWPQLPDEEIPSPIKYLQDHSPGQIAFRLAKGIATIPYRHCWQSYGHCKYVVLIGGFALYGIWLNKEKFWDIIKSNKFMAAFLVSIFGSYYLLVSWYAPIASGERQALPLFLPFLFSLTMLAQNFPIFKEVKIRQNTKDLNLLEMLLPVLLLIDLVVLVVYRAFMVYGGD